MTWRRLSRDEAPARRQRQSSYCALGQNYHGWSLPIDSSIALSSKPPAPCPISSSNRCSLAPFVGKEPSRAKQASRDIRFRSSSSTASPVSSPSASHPPAEIDDRSDAKKTPADPSGVQWATTPTKQPSGRRVAGAARAKMFAS